MPTPAQIRQAQLMRSMGLTPEHLRSISKLQLTEDNQGPQLIERGDGGAAEYGPDFINYGISSNLGDMQSKFNSVTPNEDGSFNVVFQQPGKHKYDTFEGRYVRDAKTNELTLQGDLTPTRQISRAERVKDALEQGGGYVGAGLLAAYGGAQFAGLASAGSGAGGAALASAGKAAAVNAAITAASGGDRSQITRSALMGAITGAAGSGARALTGLTGAAGNAVSGAASAATRSAISGRDAQTTLQDALIGALPGVAGVAFNDNQVLSPTSAQLVRTLGRAAVSGQMPSNSNALIIQFLSGLARQSATAKKGS